MLAAALHLHASMQVFTPRDTVDRDRRTHRRPAGRRIRRSGPAATIASAPECETSNTTEVPSALRRRSRRPVRARLPRRPRRQWTDARSFRRGAAIVLERAIATPTTARIRTPATTPMVMPSRLRRRTPAGAGADDDDPDAAASAVRPTDRERTTVSSTTALGTAAWLGPLARPSHRRRAGDWRRDTAHHRGVVDDGTRAGVLPAGMAAMVAAGCATTRCGERARVASSSATGGVIAEDARGDWASIVCTERARGIRRHRRPSHHPRPHRSRRSHAARSRGSAPRWSSRRSRA